MTAPTGYLDLAVPLPYFDLEVESANSHSGFQLLFVHLKEPFLARDADGACTIRSTVSGRTVAIRAAETLNDRIVRSVGDDGAGVVIRITESRPRP